jgi:hypothetical protein
MTTKSKKPAKKAQAKAPDAPVESAPDFNPAEDCCNRNSIGENHAPGCKSGLGGPAPELSAPADAPSAPESRAEPLELEAGQDGSAGEAAGVERVACEGCKAPEGEAHAPACPKAAAEKPDFDPTALRERDVQMTEEERIAESRKALAQPLPAGMAFFEAPDGYIVLAEANRPHVLDRRHGKAALINPRREGSPRH